MSFSETVESVCHQYDLRKALFDAAQPLLRRQESRVKSRVFHTFALVMVAPLQNVNGSRFGLLVSFGTVIRTGSGYLCAHDLVMRGVLYFFVRRDMERRAPFYQFS
jgi:hypothetical protein